MRVQIEKRTKILLAAAALLIGVTLAIPSGDSRSEPAPVPAAPTPPGAAGPKRPGVKPADPARLAEQKRRGALGWGPNPFASAPVAQAVQHPTGPVKGPMQLSGISIHGTQRWAVIGTRIVQEGDLLASGHTVLAIRKMTVTLERGEEQLVLTLDDTSGEKR